MDYSDNAFERTDIIYGEENVSKVTLQFANNARTRIDCCIDSIAVSVAVGVPQFKEAIILARERKVKLRYITEITGQNIAYCKELAKLVELRHLDSVKGNFAVNEKESISSATIMHEAKLVPKAIYSNIPEVVQQQQYLFETLWNKAIPAGQRVLEIEEGIEPATVKLISFEESTRYGAAMLASAKELLVTFASAQTFEVGINTFRINEMYKKAIEQNNAKIRLLIPAAGENIEDIVSRLKAEVPAVQARISDKALETNISIMIADRKELIIWEVLETPNSKKNPDAEDLGLGLVTYSNSIPIVSSYAKIFENLWKQTELYEKLKAHDAMQKEFINIAAHELRTPMQPILAIAEGLQSELQNAGKKKIEIEKAELEMLIRNAKRLEGLSSSILDVSRIEAQTLPLHKERFDLNEKISRVINDFKPTIPAEKEGLQIIFNPAIEELYVFADKPRIFEVLSNLIRNAIKFSSKGGKIIVAADVKNAYVTTSIKDEGVGIDKEVKSRLFEKFVSKSDSGTGLGLFVSKGIVEAHGGKIWADNNEDGKGATFSFTLPLF